MYTEPAGDFIAFPNDEKGPFGSREEGGENGSNENEKKEGGVPVAVRILFQVEGIGGFTVKNFFPGHILFDTTKGHTAGFVKPGQQVLCEPQPGPGHRFSHWLLNGNFAGTNQVLSAIGSPGLTIRCVFVQG